MRLLDPATVRTMPWKNGRGTTDELLVLPDGAALDAFDVRVSLACMRENCPFSSFPGIDRTLVVVDGAGMTLTLSDDFSVPLDQASPPFSFTADDPCDAALKDGPVTDFNVMTRRAVFRHRVTRVRLDGEESLTCTGELALVVVLTGAISAADGTRELALTKRCILALGAGEPLVRVGSESPADLLLVEIWRR